MVSSDDGDQGYAPASLLEPVDGTANSDDEQQGEQGMPNFVIVNLMGMVE